MLVDLWLPHGDSLLEMPQLVCVHIVHHTIALAKVPADDAGEPRDSQREIEAIMESQGEIRISMNFMAIEPTLRRLSRPLEPRSRLFSTGSKLSAHEMH